jgi:hypothetical protein
MKVVSPNVPIAPGSLRGMRRQAKIESGNFSVGQINIIEEGTTFGIQHLWFRQGKWTCWLSIHTEDYSLIRNEFNILLYGGRLYPYPPQQGWILAHIRNADWVLKYRDIKTKRDEWDKDSISDVVMDLINRIKLGLLSDLFFIRRNFDVYKNTLPDGIGDIVKGATPSDSGSTNH